MEKESEKSGLKLNIQTIKVMASGPITSWQIDGETWKNVRDFFWGALTWTTRRSNQSILKEISPGISLERMMLKRKLQYFGHLMRRVDSLEKTDAGRDWGQEEKGTTEDEMAGWHHGLNGYESE